MKASIFSVVCTLLFSFFVQGQTSFTESNFDFISPVDHTIRLAGSFGEIRNNHFHAGIDIKSSKGREGDTIRIVGDGYVSRIKIQRGGYGRAIYVDHPNGYTSVYAHLQVFNDTLEDYIRAVQFNLQSYEFDIYPDAHKFEFSQGEVLGLMGNTGRSYGPHLHFEIRKTQSEIPVNPYHFNIGPEDSRNPLLYSIEAYGLDVDHQIIDQKTKYIQGIDGKYGPEHTFRVPAWRAGMAIQTFDQMNGADNKNGIYELKMFVDDTLYYHHVMDQVGFDESIFINSHIDFNKKKEENRTLIKCFVSPGNPLKFYQELKNLGEFKVFEKQPRKVTFLVTDYKGNESTYSCKVLRDGQMKTKNVPSYQKKIAFQKMDTFQSGRYAFIFDSLTFDKDYYLPFESISEDSLGCQFRLGHETDPVFKPIHINIDISHLNVVDPESWILIANGDKNYGGQINNDFFYTKARALGSFTMLRDTIGPSITPITYSRNAGSLEAFTFKVEDNFEAKGMAKDVQYAVYIDMKWIPAPFKALGNILTVPIEDLNSGEHELQIFTKDHSGNEGVWIDTFTK